MGRSLDSRDRNLDSRWNLIGQVVDDKSRYTTDDPSWDASPNCE